MDVMVMELRNKKEERVLEFYVAMNMKLGNTLLRERASHQVICEFGPSKLW